jgi:hypothetical protein
MKASASDGTPIDSGGAGAAKPAGKSR